MTCRPKGRLAADEALVARLREENFEGKGWEIFTTDLIMHGKDVLTGLIYSDKIVYLCAERKIKPKLPERRPKLRDEDIQELTHDTLAEGILAFRNVLRAGKWSACKGATLRTYFVGQLLLQFPRIYTRWLEVRRRQGLNDSLTKADGSDSVVEDPTDLIEDFLDQHVAYVSWRSLEPKVQKVILLTCEGYSQREIGNSVGISKKAVEAILYRYRRLAGEEGGSE